MSLNLYVEPVKPPEPVSLGGHPLKGLIADVFFENDGSLIEEVVLTREDRPVISAMLRAETKRLSRLMRAPVTVSPFGTGIEDGQYTVDGLMKILAMIDEYGAARVFTGE